MIRILDHTADVGFEIGAPTLEALFDDSVCGELRRLVLAVPVCAAQTAAALRPGVDELVCLKAPSDLMAIGLWYQDFEQTSDEEVVELLERAGHEAAQPSERIG
jgi:predicted phosphoribosyltransferase